ncbi:MAG: glycosyltransferase family 39 protein [bacterium]
MMNRKTALILFAVALVAIFWRLGERGLNEPDEGRCAGIANEMYRSGDWLTPRLYNQGHFNKPPLLYWSSAALFHVAGVNETTARLPAALAGLATLLLTWLIGRRMFDTDTAFGAGLILLTSPLFFAMSRLIDPNMLLTCWITLAMWAAIAWIQDGRRIHLWIFYIAIALSFLTKGPVGVAIASLALAGYALRRPESLPWRPFLAAGPLAVGFVLALSWFFVVALRNPDLFDFFLRQELFDRIFTKQHHRGEPVLFYFAIIPAAMLPWLPAMLRSIAQAAKQFRTDWAVRLLSFWVLLPTIMFSLAGSKMPAYILPLLPPLALLAAHALLRTPVPAWFSRVQLGTAVTVALALPLVMAIHEGRIHGWQHPVWTASDALWLLPAALAAGAYMFTKGVHRITACAVVLLCAFLLTLGVMTRNELKIGPHTTVRGMCRVLQSQLQPGDRVALLARFPRGLSFYLDHPITIPEDKFELQVPSDRERLKDTLFSDPIEVYQWFDSTQRVFLITNDKAVSNMMTVVRTKPHEVYRDDRYLAVRNFEP